MKNKFGSAAGLIYFSCLMLFQSGWNFCFSQQFSSYEHVKSIPKASGKSWEDLTLVIYI